MDVMKRLLCCIFCVLVAISARSATLNYNLGDYTLNPTNVLFSNLVSTAQITWSMGQSGRITGTITFPTVPDENWTNIANVLTPTSANVRGLSWGTNNSLIAASLHANTPPSGQNTIYGLETATNITGGSGFNTFIGWHVASSMTSGEENTAVGGPALESVTTGEQNTAIGSDALISLQTGNDNAALGYGALGSARNSRNTSMGRGSGDALTTGGGNSFFGWFADTAVNSVTNSTALGQNALITMSNQMVFGNGVTNYQINAVDYVFPAANAAGALINDNAGFLTWGTSVPAWNVAGALNASTLRVTNESTLVGLVTNHTTLRATNIFDGGWLRVVGEQTNDAGVTLSARTASSILRTDANKAVAEVTVGSGLSFNGTTLSANVGSYTNFDNITVTNQTKLMGQTIATNIFDGGWLRVMGEQTNDVGLTLSARTASSIIRTDANKAIAEVTVGSDLTFNGTTLNDTVGAVETNLASLTVTNAALFQSGVDVGGGLTASRLRVTNETTHVGLVTNHTTMYSTNILNGGWLQSVGAVTNGGNTFLTNEFNGGWYSGTGNLTNTGNIRVNSASGLTLGTGTTITNILSGSAALTFTGVGAQRSADAVITVTGATTNDACFLGIPFQVQQGVGATNMTFVPFMSNDAVWVRCNNYGTATRSTNGVFNVLVFKR